MRGALHRSVVLALGSAVLVAGCSGAGRPSVDDVAGGLTVQLRETATDPEVLACMAELFHDSALSDEALRAIADQDDDFLPGADDGAVLADLSTESAAACGP
jgi:hypothetical protein